MDDPNLVYKAGFQALTELLGRTPLPSDQGWLALQEEYKKAWGPSEKTVLAPSTREDTRCLKTTSTTATNAKDGRSARNQIEETIPTATPTTGATLAGTASSVMTAASTGPTTTTSNTRDWSASRAEPLSGSRLIARPSEAESSPGATPSASRICQGARGPGGGLLAVCQECGREWERKKIRGRPSFRCEECR